jgi:hypothetical protein
MIVSWCDRRPVYLVRGWVPNDSLAVPRERHRWNRAGSPQPRPGHTLASALQLSLVDLVKDLEKL